MTELERRSPEWDVRFGATNYAVLVGCYAATAIASLVAVATLTRGLPPASYGQVIAMLAAAMFVQQIGIAWTALSVGALGGAEFIETGKLANVFWTRFAILVVNIAVLAATAPWWLPRCTAVLRLPETDARAVLAYMAAFALWLHMQQALVAAKRIALQAVLTLVDRAFVLACILVLAVNGGLDVTRVVQIYTASALLVSAAAVIAIRELLVPVQRFEGARVLRFSLPLLPGALANFAASNQLSTFFLAFYAGAATVASFGVAYQVHGAIVQLPMLAGVVLQPYFVTMHAAGRAHETGTMFTSFVQACCFAGSAVCLFVAAVGGPLMVRAFGVPYARSAPLLWPLMASAALAVPALMAWLPLATAVQKSYILSVNSASTATLNIALHWLLVPRFGALGAAWAILISYVGTAIVTIAVLRRERLPDCSAAVLAALPTAIAAVIALRGGTALALAAGVASLAVIAIAQRSTLRHGVTVALQLAGARR